MISNTMTKSTLFDYFSKLTRPTIHKNHDIAIWDFSGAKDDVMIMGFIKALNNIQNMSPKQFYKGVVDTFKPTERYRVTKTGGDLELFAFEAAVNFVNNLANDYILQIKYQVECITNFTVPVTYGSSAMTGCYHDVYIDFPELTSKQLSELEKVIRKMKVNTAKTDCPFAPSIEIYKDMIIINMISKVDEICSVKYSKYRDTIK